MTYDKIQVTNGVAMPNCPIERPKESDFYKRTAHDMNLGDYTLKQISEFNQWAKTQAIDAPGVPDGIYSVDELQNQAYHTKNGWADINENAYNHLKVSSSTIKFSVRLKSPLLPDGQYSVMRAGEEKQIKTPQQVLDDTARKYNLEGFGEMLYWQDGNIERCVLQAIEDYAKQFLTPPKI